MKFYIWLFFWTDFHEILYFIIFIDWFSWYFIFDYFSGLIFMKFYIWIIFLERFSWNFVSLFFCADFHEILYLIIFWTNFHEILYLIIFLDWFSWYFIFDYFSGLIFMKSYIWLFLWTDFHEILYLNYFFCTDFHEILYLIIFLDWFSLNFIFELLFWNDFH